ncbi:uncharacterized protein DC041_0003292 [Schistosoma bovis]|uniref:Origin recognition complex subunit 2 n=1 Tax=Schistosoma bovis TaxID=6184 RepID=A0A430Q886_SCHBO|nr:uncharacterized protein DC041_0003292 [Schistosoma bovis]
MQCLEFSELNISEEKENIEKLPSRAMKRCSFKKTSNTVSSKCDQKLIEDILNCICHEFLHVADSCKNPTEQLQLIYDLFKKDEAEKSPLFLLLNNIDGPGLRNGKAQAVLARLAEIQHIHLVASLDHANMPL